jgi:hypothetical protein
MTTTQMHQANEQLFAELVPFVREVYELASKLDNKEAVYRTAESIHDCAQLDSRAKQMLLDILDWTAAHALAGTPVEKLVEAVAADYAGHLQKDLLQPNTKHFSQ